MKIYALANELNLDRSNAGTITVPFGTWDYGQKKLPDGRNLFFRQTLDMQGAGAIAAQIADSIAKGEKGVPVYWGHPDVPELAHKYPDKRAKGWITSASVEDGKLVLSVDWLEDKATDGFGWFSPFWTGPVKENGDGTALMHVESLTSVALINMPNIQEFRLANEAQPEERKTMKPYQLPQRIIDLANEYDESKHPRAEDGKWTSGGGSGGGGDKVITITGDEDWMGEMPKIEQTPENRARGEAAQMLRKTKAYRSASVADKDRMLDTETKRVLRKNLYTSLEKKVGSGMAVELFRTTGLSEIDVYGDPAKVERAAHRAAILSGLKYNHGTRSYS